MDRLFCETKHACFMKKNLLLGLAIAGLLAVASAPATAAPRTGSKAFPNRLHRTMRRLHRQSLVRVRKNKRLHQADMR